MEIVKSLVIASVFIPAIRSFAAEPQFQFDLNRDGKSYAFQIQNPLDRVINCTSLEITAQIGNSDCTRILSSNVQTLRNVKISSSGVILESNFGIDHLSLINRDLKPEEKKVYCGQPEVKAICQ